MPSLPPSPNSRTCSIALEVMGRTPEDVDGDGVAPIRHRTTDEVARAVELNEKARALYLEVGQFVEELEKTTEDGVSSSKRGGLTRTHKRLQKAMAAAEWCQKQHPKFLVHLSHAKELDAFEVEVAKSRNRNVQRLEGEARQAEQVGRFYLPLTFCANPADNLTRPPQN